MVFATALDVTERRRMEDELRASRERALEASRLKSEFVANMSHEIRTPLNGVVSMAELLLGTRLSGEQAEYAQVALTSAEALMRVINDILDFSKIEAGKLEIVERGLLAPGGRGGRGARSLGVRRGRPRALSSTSSSSDDVADVLRGDGNRIRQVLTNLVSNAIKFTARGGSRSPPASRRRPATGEQLRIEVADTGIGIDPDRLPALFAAVRAGRRHHHPPLRRHRAGAVHLQAAGRADGRADRRCTASPGEGSRFWFTVPVRAGRRLWLRDARQRSDRHPRARRRRRRRRPAGDGAPPDRLGDQPGQRIRRPLGAAPAAAATETGRPFEAALIDLSMPEMDGLELARAIKAVPALRSTRLILVTAAPVPAAEAEAAGIEAQLVKPVRQSRLYDQLCRPSCTRSEPHRPWCPLRCRARRGPRRPGPGPAGGGQPDQPVCRGPLLQTLGFRVDVAANGREAIAMTARTDYAAVFMDCQMPDVDGYTAARVIRRRERHTVRTCRSSP